MEVLDLPPGFRFHPTDEEIITYYLTQKVINGGSFSATAIGEADLNKSEPWDLPQKAKMGEKEWYFYCQRDRKYPTGMRTNRATESGYWKATGKDKEIFQGKSCLVGMKKTLVFYKGRAPKGEKTNWVMHEYRLEGKFQHHHHLHLLPKSVKDEWVVCRIFHKNVSMGFKRLQIPGTVLPPLVDPTNPINIDTDGFNDVVFKQPIRNYSQLQANSSSDGMMMIDVSQIRSNNNPEFTFFSSEKMMNYYTHEQQAINSGPVVAPASDRSFVDIPDVKNTPEISSVDDHCYEDFDGPGAISDLEHLWEY